MIWVDYCIVALLVVSTVVGVLRGFARETLGLITWVVAIWAALAFAKPVAQFLEPHIAVPSVRIAASYAITFLAVLLVGAIATALIVRSLRDSVLSSVDRSLGGGFGLLRGALVVAAFVLVAGMTPARQDPWWQQSSLIKQFEWMAESLRSVLPQNWLEQLKPAVEDVTGAAADVHPSSL